MQYKMILATYRHILREHVICVQYDGAKISYRIEFERHFNRFTGHTHWIVTPTNPFVTCVCVFGGAERENEYDQLECVFVCECLQAITK